MSEARGAEEVPGSPVAEYSDERTEGLFWSQIEPAREPVQWRWFLPAVGLLLLLNVPWYLPSELEARMFGGLPLWSWIALATSFALALLTAVAALYHWRDEE